MEPFDKQKDAEWRSEQHAAYRKFLETAAIPTPGPKDRYELNWNDRQFLRSLKIDPDK